jgi:hypothetical protein
MMEDKSSHECSDCKREHRQRWDAPNAEIIKEIERERPQQ